jgi:hypothetical protein
MGAASWNWFGLLIFVLPRPYQRICVDFSTTSRHCYSSVATVGDDVDEASGGHRGTIAYTAPYEQLPPSMRLLIPSSFCNNDGHASIAA